MMNKSSFQLMNIRSKVDITFSKNVKLILNLNPSYDIKTSPSENFTNFARFPSYLNVYHTEKSAAWVRQNPQYANVQAGDYAQPRHWGGRISCCTRSKGELWACLAKSRRSRRSWSARCAAQPTPKVAGGRIIT